MRTTHVGVFQGKTGLCRRRQVLVVEAMLQDGFQAAERECWDNAPTESWFNSFKNEWVHGIRYATHAKMKATSFEYIEVFYNRKRQHSTLGYRSPMQLMENWLNEQQQEKQVA